MKEVKEIVDFIAEQSYNEEVARKKAQPKEELPKNRIFGFSFIQYLIHSFLPKFILAEVLVAGIVFIGKT